MIGPSRMSGIITSTVLASRARLPAPTRVASATSILEPTTAVSTPTTAQSTAATAARGCRIQVPTVASAASAVMIPGTPSSVSIGIGNVASRAGSTVWSTPEVRAGSTVQPRMTAAPASTTIVRESSIGAHASAMRPAIAAARSPSPYSPPSTTATSCHGLLRS